MQAQGFELGVLDATGRFTGRDAIAFRWSSTLQTMGSATAERRFLPEQTNEVFIVHGRDDQALGEVEAFVRKIGLIPVVLGKEPNRGMPTILDKFERHAPATGFAIVVFSPDDLGFLKSEPHSPERRARQNVVFELGYFLGRFGRRRVCVLVNGPIVAPSDIGGYAWTADISTDGGWKEKLRLELAAAG